VRCAAAALADLTQAPSTQRPGSGGGGGLTKAQAAAAWTRRRGLGGKGEEEEEEGSDDGQEGGSQRQRVRRGRFALAAAKEAARAVAKSDAAVAAASPSFAAVASAGGLAALADASLAAAAAAAALLDGSSLPGGGAAVVPGRRGGGRGEEAAAAEAAAEARAAEGALEEWVEVRRSALAAFARHDMLDAARVKRFGGRDALAAAVLALQWTNRARYGSRLSDIHKSGAEADEADRVFAPQATKLSIPATAMGSKEGLARGEAQALGGLAVLAAVHLLLRVSAADLLPLHLATAERDLGRLAQAAGILDEGETPAAAAAAAREASGAMQKHATTTMAHAQDTPRWFFVECRRLEHLRAAAGDLTVAGDLTAASCGAWAAGSGSARGFVTSPAVSAAGAWALRTLRDHWPEFVHAPPP